ncbi:hypothetical protein C8J57DRAFT_1518619 [Mycena rebaudengoi]|nr:hypothetical protein C8J57DRAFT_1518619 [Mycena rebaudengoi]
MTSAPQQCVPAAATPSPRKSRLARPLRRLGICAACPNRAPACAQSRRRSTPLCLIYRRVPSYVAKRPLLADAAIQLVPAGMINAIEVVGTPPRMSTDLHLPRPVSARSFFVGDRGPRRFGMFV